jgi:uncharacterized MnhB-related membrane protein
MNLNKNNKLNLNLSLYKIVQILIWSGIIILEFVSIIYALINLGLVSFFVTLGFCLLGTGLFIGLFYIWFDKI